MRDPSVISNLWMAYKSSNPNYTNTYGVCGFERILVGLEGSKILPEDSI
jgi:hypothetical protein